MSGTTPSARSRRSGVETKKFWQPDLGKSKSGQNTEVDHPPFTPMMPRVNLLPRTIVESIAVRKIRRGFVLAFLTLIAAVVGIWLMQNGGILEATGQLAAVQQENATLTEQTAALAPVGNLYEQITNQEKFIGEALASEIKAAEVLSQLYIVAGPDIAFSNIGVVYTGVPKPELANDPAASLNLCPNADPFSRDITIGCMTFTAQGANRTDVSDFLNRAAANPYFVGTYVTATTVGATAQGTPILTFTGSSGVSLEGLKTPLTNEQITALRQSAIPPAAPSVDPSAGTG